MAEQEPVKPTEQDPLGQPTDYVLGWKRVAVGLAPPLIGLATYGIGVLAGAWAYGAGLFPAFVVWVFASALAPHAYVRRRTALALGIGLAVPSFAAVLAMNFSVVRVEGASMEPTLLEGDTLLVDDKAEPAPGIWVLEVPGENNPLVKRLVDPPAGAEPYWVLGDNETASRDSRHFGRVGREAIKGRVAWSLKGSHGFGPIK